MDTSAVPQGVNVNAMFTSCAFPPGGQKNQSVWVQTSQGSFPGAIEFHKSTNTHFTYEKSLWSQRRNDSLGISLVSFYSLHFVSSDFWPVNISAFFFFTSRAAAPIWQTTSITQISRYKSYWKLCRKQTNFRQTIPRKFEVYVFMAKVRVRSTSYSISVRRPKAVHDSHRLVLTSTVKDMR